MTNPLQSNNSENWFEQLVQIIRQEDAKHLLTKSEIRELYSKKYLSENKKILDNYMKLKRRLRRLIVRVAKEHARSQPPKDIRHIRQEIEKLNHFLETHEKCTCIKINPDK